MVLGHFLGRLPSTSSTTVTVTDNENTNEGNALIFAADADLDGGTISLESDGGYSNTPLGYDFSNQL